MIQFCEKMVGLTAAGQFHPRHTDIPEKHRRRFRGRITQVEGDGLCASLDDEEWGDVLVFPDEVEELG